jgi:hypothetical protein
MGKLLEMNSGFVTAPSTVQVALTMASGSSGQVKTAKAGSLIKLLAAWTDQQTAGYLRLRSSRLHDAAQGIRLYSVASDVENLIPYGSPQRLYPGDILSIDLSGSATAGDIESAAWLLYYDDMEGVDAKLITFDEMQKRGVNYVVVENTLALGTTGGFSGEEGINAEYDLLKAGVDYALAGYTVNTECTAVSWRGVDSGNSRVGGPGNETEKEQTSNWFVTLARRFNMALIPVFNANNKSGILIDGVQDENGADPLVNSMFVELAPK